MRQISNDEKCVDINSESFSSNMTRKMPVKLGLTSRTADNWTLRDLFNYLCHF